MGWGDEFLVCELLFPSFVFGCDCDEVFFVAAAFFVFPEAFREEKEGEEAEGKEPK